MATTPTMEVAPRAHWQPTERSERVLRYLIWLEGLVVAALWLWLAYRTRGMPTARIDGWWLLVPLWLLSAYWFPYVPGAVELASAHLIAWTTVWQMVLLALGWLLWRSERTRSVPSLNGQRAVVAEGWAMAVGWAIAAATLVALAATALDLQLWSEIPIPVGPNATAEEVTVHAPAFSGPRRMDGRIRS